MHAGGAGDWSGMLSKTFSDSNISARCARQLHTLGLGLAL